MLFSFISVGRSCKEVKRKIEKKGKTPKDGIYKIAPSKGISLDVYCDMTRDGGGWTLLVSSYTNTWDSQNVYLRNVDSPDLDKDYSILMHGNALKNDIKIKDSTFQFRLEADSHGRKMFFFVYIYDLLYSVGLKYSVFSNR